MNDSGVADRLTAAYNRFFADRLRTEIDGLGGRRRHILLTALGGGFVVFVFFAAISCVFFFSLTKSLGDLGSGYWLAVFLPPLSLGGIAFSAIYILLLRRLLGSFRTAALSTLREFIGSGVVYHPGTAFPPAALAESGLFGPDERVSPGERFTGSHAGSDYEFTYILADRPGTRATGAFLSVRPTAGVTLARFAPVAGGNGGVPGVTDAIPLDSPLGRHAAAAASADRVGILLEALAAGELAGYCKDTSAAFRISSLADGLHLAVLADVDGKSGGLLDGFDFAAARDFCIAARLGLETALAVVAVPIIREST